MALPTKAAITRARNAGHPHRGDCDEMASARQIIFTREDEATFSAALLKKFPEAIFIDKGAWPEPILQKRGSLADCESGSASVWFPPRRWRPKFAQHADGSHYVINTGPRALVYFGYRHPYLKTERTWEKDGMPPAIYDGVLHVSYGRPTPQMKRFAGQVWRVLGKVASYGLVDIAVPSGRVIYPTNGDRRWIAAGHHAILWAAARPDRVFCYFASSALAPDKGRAIYPMPEAIAEARAAVLGEGTPPPARKRRHGS